MVEVGKLGLLRSRHQDDRVRVEDDRFELVEDEKMMDW